MAIEDSTTASPSGARAPSPTKPASLRRLTVMRRPDGKPDTVPLLRVHGRWLDEAGFLIGSKVRVLVSPKRLVIELIDFPEGPRLDPPRPNRSRRSSPT